MNLRISLLLVCGLQLISISLANAGFLDMPEITEPPDLERRSFLLDMDIPSVRERDPDPESGPRLNVTKFNLQGIVEYPELGITRREIEKLVERIRFELMEEYKLLDSGYTQDEVNQIIDMLVDIENETLDRHVTDLDLQKLVWLIREQRTQRGITLGTIETAADKITQFYRERGFILAKAYIPEQQVRDGIVTLTLLLGMLGDVKVENNSIYNDRIIASVFDDALAKPVTSRVIEEKIYLINDYPGLTVVGLFEPGYQVGDTLLGLNVKDEKRYQANLRIDNHGSEDTGTQRIYADFQVNNLVGLADQLHLGALNSFSPDNTTYWQLQYSLNLFSPRWRLITGLTQNQFILDQDESELLANLELSGQTEQKDIAIDYKLRRSRASNYSLNLSWENIVSDLTLGNLNDPSGLLDDEIENYGLRLDYDILNDESKTLHQGNLKLVSGQFIEGNDPGQDDSYSILKSDYTFLSFMKIPFTDIDTRIIMRTSLQFTGSALSSINQFALGGPTRARGYPVDQFSADNAAYLGIDWVFNLPGWLDFKLSSNRSLKDFTQPFLFFDASYGIKRSLRTDSADSKATLYDAGLGFRLFYLNNLQGNLQFAFPLNNDFSDIDLEAPDDSVRMVFDVQYSFR